MTEGKAGEVRVGSRKSLLGWTNLNKAGRDRRDAALHAKGQALLADAAGNVRRLAHPAGVRVLQTADVGPGRGRRARPCPIAAGWLTAAQIAAGLVRVQIVSETRQC